MSLGCHDLSSRCEGKGGGIGFPTRARPQGKEGPLPVLAFPTPPALKAAFPPEPIRPRVRVAGPPTRPSCSAFLLTRLPLKLPWEALRIPASDICGTQPGKTLWQTRSSVNRQGVHLGPLGQPWCPLALHVAHRHGTQHVGRHDSRPQHRHAGCRFRFALTQ